ncbi:MAG: crotonobetainyl-CoA--carnitine CoA-transferase [Candidatus Omnitrophica bacterium]|nr:crotonobetainyl-CoA--carnitine CoA-transferase [Candidatus Omnitrophota bacterium]
MKKKQLANTTYASQKEKQTLLQFVRHFKKCPIPDEQILSNLGLFLNSKNLSRVLFMDHLYRKIIDLQGSIVEFGVRWGQNLALFAALRGIYDTFNRHRKIIGFDTFEGFPGISQKDGSSELMKKGNLCVSKNYVKYLEKILELQEKDNPLAHIKKFELCPGDAIVGIKKYLTKHPETIIALAYFDFDLYEPTKECLKLILPHVAKGSVIGFDELNDPDSPGETIALREVLKNYTVKIERYRYASRTSYIVLE